MREGVRLKRRFVRGLGVTPCLPLNFASLVFGVALGSVFLIRCVCAHQVVTNSVSDCSENSTATVFSTGMFGHVSTGFVSGVAEQSSSSGNLE